MKTHLLIATLILAISAIAGWHWFGSEEQEKLFITSPTARMDLEETVLANGTLEASKMISVGAQVSGQLEKLHVELGSKVVKDQLIAEIDSLTQQNSLENSEAALEDMKAQLLAKEALAKEAKSIYKRQKKMSKRDAVSKESLESAETEAITTESAVISLKAQIKQAEIEVDTAKVNLGYTKITAPISGTVVAIVTEEGQTVNSAQEAPTIVMIAQLETMTIKAEISEADITRVKKGQKVRFTILGEPDHYYHASLRAIEPAPDTISEDTTSTSSTTDAIYYNGLFDAPNEDGKLRISMTTEVYIVLNESKNALTIPSTALGEPTGENQYNIMVHNKTTGHTSPRTVKIGINNNVNAEVLSGLNDNDIVVVGSSTVTDEEAASTTSQHRGPPPMGM